MLEMVVELQDDRTMFKKNLVRVEMFKKSLGMYKELFELLLQETFQIFEKIEELSANICMMARIQRANINSDEWLSYDSAFIIEVQTPSTRYMNPLFSNSNHEQTYYAQPRIINSKIGNDKINSDIIFDDSNVEVNSGSVEHDKNAHDLHDNELEQLARNAYNEAEKQKILDQKDKIRALEKERDDLQLNVSEQRKQVLELQTVQTSLKHKLNANKDKYLNDLLNFEAKLKKNENVVIKMSKFVQALFKLGPKPLSVYDPQLKHGLGYENPYTLKQAIFKNLKLYDALYLHSSKVHVNVCDTEEILKDATSVKLKWKTK
ncbi:hypothetical protein Tco_0184669 [Tanacetum coccineum]